MSGRAVLIAGLALLAAATPATADVPEVDPLELTPEIERFVDERVGPSQVRKLRVHRLMDAIFGQDGLDITYGNANTKTAAETFESRSGNCLSFTMLFVAMARQVDLAAHFVEVAEVLSWDRRGELVVSNRHMFAEVEIAGDVMRVDFFPGAEKRYRAMRRVGDRRVRALYYNNLGAEKLVAGDAAGAQAYFRKALEIDDTLAIAFVNLGVAHRKLGEFEAAERSYERAMELDPDEISALSNLAGLYLGRGRYREARPLLRRVAAHQRRNPFHHFRLGVQSAANGELRTAVKRLKRAIRLMPEDSAFHAALADVYLEAGKRRKARDSLIRALKRAEDDGQKEEIERRLAALEERD